MLTDTRRGLVAPFADLRGGDVEFAGGKGANLGELTSAGFPVPAGFVVGAPAYAAFCDQSGLRARLEQRLESVDVDDSDQLAAASREVRGWINEEPLDEELRGAITSAYVELAAGDSPVAVRSSATAEDTASASFAGMNETYLNVLGAEEVLDAVRRCWASLFGARTVFYRAKRGFGQADMDIAVVVQNQLLARRAGVMFTVEPATGDESRMVIEGAFGLGESVVSGSVSPDRYVFEKEALTPLVREVRSKAQVVEADPGGGVRVREATEEEAASPVLTDDEARRVAQLGLDVEAHYGSGQDTEWAIDDEGSLWLLQARPITVSEGGDRVGAPQGSGQAEEVLVRGLGAAPGSAAGRTRVVVGIEQAREHEAGEVLVAPMTTPDWVPLMRRASAIVTDSGGMTCHAAIVSRELGIPCVVGAGDATRILSDGREVTVDGSRGVVVSGRHEAPAEPAAASPVLGTPPSTPVTATQVLVNLSEPSQAERAASLDVDGVGLLRAELMLIEALDGAHPRKLLDGGRRDELVERLASSLERFAIAFSPRPVTYRTIDFRTNEFRGLDGGEDFEPQEANPMIGYRGALRYAREPDLFAVELDAISQVWGRGLTNLHVMLPFVRTPVEVERLMPAFEEAGLAGSKGFELWVMAEVPSILFNLERLAELGVAGISIGSNDLTQLLLGADRDSGIVAEVFDERDPAVRRYLEELIPLARQLGLRTSICGQAPSVHPEYADILVRAGIDAVSVTPDAVDRARRQVAAAERRLMLAAARAKGSVSGGWTA